MGTWATGKGKVFKTRKEATVWAKMMRKKGYIAHIPSARQRAGWVVSYMPRK